jgi:hypothetical protein
MVQVDLHAIQCDSSGHGWERAAFQRGFDATLITF